MKPAKCLVPVSGGKDSQACMRLAVDSFGHSNVLGIYEDTGFDHSLTLEHLKYMSSHYGVPIVSLKSKRYNSVPECMEDNGWPTSGARSCTRILKMKPWFDWLKEHAAEHEPFVVYLGMRAQESYVRKQNYGHLIEDETYELSDLYEKVPKPIRKVRVALPIVQWSKAGVFSFLKLKNDKVNPLYAKGHPRIGCFPCVMSTRRQVELAARDPEGRRNIQLLFKAAAVAREKNGKTFIPEDWTHIDEDLRSHDPLGFYEDDENGGACQWCVD